MRVLDNASSPSSASDRGPDEEGQVPVEDLEPEEVGGEDDESSSPGDLDDSYEQYVDADDSSRASSTLSAPGDTVSVDHQKSFH